MKTATVIVLLAALVCSVICDPDRPDNKKQTAEAEGYGYGSGVSFFFCTGSFNAADTFKHA